jgi:hypothetical protein
MDSFDDSQKFQVIKNSNSFAILLDPIATIIGSKSDVGKPKLNQQ